MVQSFAAVFYLNNCNHRSSLRERHGKRHGKRVQQRYAKFVRFSFQAGRLLLVQKPAGEVPLTERECSVSNESDLAAKDKYRGMSLEKVQDAPSPRLVT